MASLSTDDAALLPIVHKKIQDSVDSINEVQKNLMETLTDQNKVAYEKLCQIMSTIMQNVQTTVDTRREQIEDSKSSNVSVAQHDHMYNLDTNRYLLPTKTLRPVMSNPYKNMPYASKSDDPGGSAMRALKNLEDSLALANVTLQEFAKGVSKNQQILYQMYKSFLLNYSSRVIQADFILKSTMDVIPFAVPGYGLAGIKVVLELSKNTMPVKFDTKRKEYVDELEKNNTSNTLDVDWLAFLKDINPNKARGLVSRYLTPTSKNCTETVFQYYASMYKHVDDISAWMHGNDSGTFVGPTSLEARLDSLFPGYGIAALVSATLATTPESLMSSTQIRCAEPKLSDSLSLKEYLERDAEDFCADVERSSKRQRTGAGGDDNNTFICRGINLFTDDTDDMINTIEYMSAQGFSHDEIVEHVVDRSCPFVSRNSALDDTMDFTEGGASKNSVPKSINMPAIREAFSQTELNKLVAPIGHTLINSHKIFQFQNFNFHNQFVDIGAYFEKDHTTINDFYNNVTRFYSGEGEICLWQLLHNCFDKSMLAKLQRIVAADFPNWSKALFISKVCMDESMIDQPVGKVIADNARLLFPLDMSFREAAIISQYFARNSRNNRIAKPDISLYCPLDIITLQPHIFITVLYIVGLYRNWLDGNLAKTSKNVGATAMAKNNILTQVHSFLTGNTGASHMLTTLLLAKSTDFVLRTMSVAQIKEFSEVSRTGYLQGLQKFGTLHIGDHQELMNELPNLAAAADTFHSKINVGPCLDPAQNNLFIANYQMNQWAQICLDQLSFGSYLKRQPAGDSIITLNRNLAITLFVQNKSIYEAMHTVPELNESSIGNIDDTSLLSELDTILDLDALGRGGECALDSVYLRKGGQRHMYLVKFLHDCLTNRSADSGIESFVDWHYYYISKDIADLNLIALPNNDTMQLISYANIFSQPFAESFFEHTSDDDENLIVGESRAPADNKKQRIFMSPYVVEARALVPAGSFAEIVGSEDRDLDKTLELYVPIRTSNFSNFKAIRHADNLIVMNANTPYMVMRRLVDTFNKFFGSQDKWSVQTSQAQKPGYTKLAILPSNMTTPKTTAGLYYHISKRAPNDPDSDYQFKSLLEYCAPIDEIVIDCSVIGLAAASGGGSATLPFFDNVDYEVCGGMILMDPAGAGKRKARRRAPAISGESIALSRDFETQYKKSREAQANKLLSKLNKWDSTYRRYMDNMTNTCDTLQSEPMLPDMKGFFVEFSPTGIRETFTKFDAKAAASAAQDSLNIVPMNNTFSSLFASLDKMNITASDTNMSITNLHKNLAQFTLLLNVAGNSHRNFIQTALEAVQQIQKYLLFAICGPLAQLHFYRNMSMYLFNEMPPEYSYLERFLSRDGAYLQLNVQNYGTYLAENVDFFERDPALYNYYIFFQNMSNAQRTFLFILTPSHVLRSSSSMFYLGLIAIFLSHSLESWRKIQNASTAVPLTAAAVTLPVVPIPTFLPTRSSVTTSVLPPSIFTVPSSVIPPANLPTSVIPPANLPLSSSVPANILPPANLPTSTSTVPARRNQPVRASRNQAPPPPSVISPTLRQKQFNDNINDYSWIPLEAGRDWNSMAPLERTEYLTDNFRSIIHRDTPNRDTKFEKAKNYIILSNKAARIIYKLFQQKSGPTGPTLDPQTLSDWTIIVSKYLGTLLPNVMPTNNMNTELQNSTNNLEQRLADIRAQQAATQPPQTTTTAEADQSVPA